MNRFNEFDQIKTPANWIETAANANFKTTKNKRSIKVKYTFAVVLIILAVGISSLTITYALSESFRGWLNEQFGDDTIITDSKDLPGSTNKDTIALDLEKERWYIENQFIGIVDDNYMYKKVYILENDKLVECPVNEFQGDIDGNNYSFKYAKYENRIIGYDFQGCVVGVLPKVVNNMIYVTVDLSNKFDLARINLDTGKLEYITNDHISVNPIASPNQTNILINKNHQVWENYNTETGVSNVVKTIDPYMHSNVITFIDENTVVTYDENGSGILVDVLTDTSTPLDKFPLEGTLVNIDYTDDKIIFTNIITGAVCQMDYVYTSGTYCNLNYIVLFNIDKLYLYDIDHNKVIDLNSDKKADEKLVDVLLIDDSHLFITTDKRVYILANKGLNG